MSYNAELLHQELLRDEGKRLTSYRDSLGNWTVGIGHLLRPNEPRKPINEAQCLALFEADVMDAETTLDQIFPKWRDLSDVRQRAMVNLAFNLGGRLRQFVRFLAAMDRGDWNDAGQHLRASKWAKQVKRRAPRIIHMIVTDTAWEGL